MDCAYSLTSICVPGKHGNVMWPVLVFRSALGVSERQVGGEPASLYVTELLAMGFHLVTDAEAKARRLRLGSLSAPSTSGEIDTFGPLTRRQTRPSTVYTQMKAHGKLHLPTFKQRGS